MSHAALVVVAVFLAPALCRINRLVHGKDNIHHGYLVHGFCQPITATRATYAAHQLAATQLAEQLFQIRQGNFLPFTDASVLVAEWGKTPRRLLTGLLEEETELTDYIVGVVLNNVDLNALPRFTDIGGLERFAFRAEQRLETAPN